MLTMVNLSFMTIDEALIFKTKSWVQENGTVRHRDGHQPCVKPRCTDRHECEGMSSHGARTFPTPFLCLQARQLLQNEPFPPRPIFLRLQNASCISFLKGDIVYPAEIKCSPDGTRSKFLDMPLADTVRTESSSTGKERFGMVLLDWIYEEGERRWKLGIVLYVRPIVGLEFIRWPGAVTKRHALLVGGREGERIIPREKE